MNDAVLTKKHELLEQILFAPSPILESLELNLRTRDVISLAGVCQRWRGYLVPGYHDIESKGGVEKIHYDQSHISWHPLLRTIRPCTQTSLQRRHIICKMGLRCWPPLPQGYHNTSVKDIQNRKPKMINPARLVAIFGDRYFSTAITRIHLDGLTKRFGDGGNGPLLEWIFQCKNLVEISFRWCSLVDVEELAREFVEDPEGVYERQYRKKWRERWPSEPLDKMTEAIPPKLKRFLFWGAGRIPSMEYEIGKEPSKGQVIRGALFDKWALKECVSRLIERYQTDVEWCENEVHYRGTGECRSRGKWDMRLHEKVKQRCEVCESIVEAQCIVCDLRNICDICLGFVCNRCLKVRSSSDTETQNQEDISDFNMLQFRCIRFPCEWRGGIHYIHPSCSPSSLVCTNCSTLSCGFCPSMCKFCGAGNDCCRKGDMHCLKCRTTLCGGCGNCEVDGHADYHRVKPVRRFR
ncbi:hypothetical protein EYR41_000475 [Orbilia oligospora]|uniref:Uncharacterized protein n=1 Tax=Orbilia oligospora TaxID=2813651 RepID=A0A8H2E6F9_ORBOL|nr:hypothetical protein EYR41_000475 [Orbilia oligospora]